MAHPNHLNTSYQLVEKYNIDILLFMCLMILVVLFVLIKKVKKIKNIETSPERVSRLKRQREYTNKCKQNKLKKLKDLVPIIIDIENTKNRNNDYLEFNTPVTKKFKVDITTPQESNQERIKCDRNSKIRQKRAEETTQQILIKNNERSKRLNILNATLTPEQKKIKNDKNKENKRMLRKNKLHFYEQKNEIEYFQCCRVLMGSTLALVRFAGNRFGGRLGFKLRNCCLKTLLKLFES
jgi:hypothetical protein